MKKLNIEEIKQKTKILNIEYYQQIDSTHIYAKRTAEFKENGTVIIAEVQTNGIGTKGRSWHTGKGNNIACTVILKPDVEAKQLEGLTVKIAQNIKKVIKELYGYDLEIKEPNDLMLNGKKICGILTETHIIGEKVKYLLISFGFNVNEEMFVEEIKDKATSLKREFKKEFQREEIISNILKELMKINF